MVVDDSLKYEFNSEKFDNLSNTLGVSYVVCATPRSGSTLLAEGLKSTNLAGMPHEYFNIDHKSDYFKRWHFKSLEEYVKLLKKYRVSDNGIFGFKIHFNQFSNEFVETDLEKYFPNLKYVFIKRQDKIAQGISLEKAYQTNQWSSKFDSDRAAQFKFKDIKKRVNDISAQELSWDNYFRINNIEPLVVHYEELEKNYEASIIRILKYLRVDHSSPIPPMQIKKQRNLTNRIWKMKYKLFNFIKL